jgi:predicted transcriptional regulator
MKQILIEIDDRCARELEHVAPAKKRMRAEFIRLAIRHAVDAAMDRATADAYRVQPLEGGTTDDDLGGWDVHNALASHGHPAKRAGRRKARTWRAA